MFEAVSEDLVNDWIQAQKVRVESVEYKKYQWAADKLIDAAISNPCFLWEAILKVIATESSDLVLQSIGAGPLEDLMVNHSDEYIDVIIREAKQNEPLREAMSYVWLDDEDSNHVDSFFSAASRTGTGAD